MNQASSKIGFAIGNGTSRQYFDLEKLRGHGLIVGCNWLYKDFEPDIIVALDHHPRTVIADIKERSWKFMTWGRGRAHLLLDGEVAMSVINVNRTKGKNSGIVACSYLAKEVKVERLYMIGFDFFRIYPDQRKQDVYSDRKCLFKNFNKAFNWLSEDCPDTEFIRVGPTDPHDVAYYETMQEHFTFIDYPEFEERLAESSL